MRWVPIKDMLNGSNGLSTNTGPTNTEPIDEHAGLVQNYLDIFRGATPDNLKGSIQDCKGGMKRDIEVQKEASKLRRWIRGDTAETLDRRIRGMRVVSEAMKGLLRMQRIRSRAKN